MNKMDYPLHSLKEVNGAYTRDINEMHDRNGRSRTYHAELLVWPLSFDSVNLLRASHTLSVFIYGSHDK